ncbi:DUF4226 domain-containing protein [Mycobacterium kansasii]
MGFWDSQVEELMTGIGTLVGGGRAPLAPPSTPSPSPPAPPEPTDLLPPAPAYDPSESGPYPPYIPETEMPLTSGTPRSTIDGIHGTTDNEPVIWPPRPSGIGDAAGERYTGLPPYFLHEYREIAPGIWVPDDRPSPPGQTEPAGMSSWTGKAADAAKAAEESLRQNRSALHETDRGLGESMVQTQDAAENANRRLRDIREEIDAGVRALQPTLDTPAGQQQMAAFLTAKANDARAVIVAAQQTATAQATALAGVRTRYDTIR